MSNNSFNLIVRNAYLRDRDSVFDIGIVADRIKQVKEKISERGEREIDAAGNLVSPGFVDCHTHMDKSLTGMGGRFPKYNDLPYDRSHSGRSRDDRIRVGLEYFRNATFEEIKKHVIEHAYMQVANGTTWTRTHVDIDSVVQTRAVEAVLAARKELRSLIDIQVVGFAQSGLLRDGQSESLLRKALHMGADLVGIVDPATLDNNLEASLDLAFQVAKEFDVGLDHHIMDPGSLGLYSLTRLAQKASENDYKGRVTASHSFCLADAPKELLDRAIPVFKEAGMKFVTCYHSSPQAMPIKRFLEVGIPVGMGSDNIRDFWIAQGCGDIVQGALVETQRLNMTTNQDMDLLWRMITTEGAKVLGITDDYGIGVGKKADLVVLNAPSPQWAIITQPKKLVVVKAGQVVAENGQVLSDVTS